MTIKTTSDHEIISVDVFDTLLLRELSPDDTLDSVLSLISNLTNSKYDRSSFEKDYLKVAEINLSKGLDLEVQWDQLLKSISTTTQLTTSEIESCFLVVERSLTSPNPEVVKKLTHIVSNGGRVIFISDIYYSSDFLKKVLSNHGLLGITVNDGYTSGDFGLLKKTGNIFKKILEKEKITSFSSWSHFGDCKTADYQMPKLKGIHSELYLSKKNIERTGFQKFLYKLENKKIINRESRLLSELGYLQPVKDSHDIATILMNPLLYGYFTWMVNDLKNKKIKKVLFVSREGYILKNSFDIFKKIFSLDIEAHYFYCSRKVALSFSFSRFTPDIIENVQINGGETLSDFFNAVSPPDVRKLNLDHRDEVIFSRIPKDRTLKRAEYLNRLIERPSFKDWIEAVKNQQSLFGTYLAQIGIISGETFAFGDIGWGGQIQHNLSLGFDRIDKKCHIEGYYFFLNDTAETRQRPGSYYSAYLSSSFNQHWSTSYAFAVPQLLELLIRAPHGTVTGFCKDHTGRIHPVFKSDSSPSRQAELLMEPLCKNIENIVLDTFPTAIVKFYFLNISQDSILRLNRQLIEGFTKFPTKPLVSLLSDTVNIADLGSDEQTRLVDNQNGFSRKALKNSIWKSAYLKSIAPFGILINLAYFLRWHLKYRNKSVNFQSNFNQMQNLKINKLDSILDLNHKTRVNILGKSDNLELSLQFIASSFLYYLLDNNVRMVRAHGRLSSIDVFLTQHFFRLVFLSKKIIFR